MRTVCVLLHALHESERVTSFEIPSLFLISLDIDALQVTWLLSLSTNIIESVFLSQELP